VLRQQCSTASSCRSSPTTPVGEGLTAEDRQDRAAAVGVGVQDPILINTDIQAIRTPLSSSVTRSSSAASGPMIPSITVSIRSTNSGP
jgi:hypothetical protein